jgi:hypothetical protein
MRFPVQKGASKAKAKSRTGKCLECGRSKVHEPHGFAFLNAGALRKIDKRNSVMAADLEGFLTLGFHGAHSGTKNEPSAYLPVAEDSPLGQFEVYFCTTKCLRSFFNRCVDELERRIAKNAS